MSEDEARSVDDPAAEGPQEPVGGERLAAARREKQISIVEIAKELHLDEGKVRALERNEYDALGAPVFAKGHLRKYAELVGVDRDDVMTDYYRLTRASGMPPIVSGRPKVHKELAPGPWVALVIMVVAIAAAYWWLGVREPLPSAPQRAAPAMPIEEPPAVRPEDSATEAAEVVPEDASAQATEPDEPAPVAESTATGPAAAASAAAGGQMRLGLRFSGDCWTEITDATGRRLFFGLGRDGQTVDLAGAAPVSVLFGNGNNVSLVVDGEAYELPATTRPDQPLRLTLVRTR